MSEETRQITIKHCDFCNVEESIIVGKSTNNLDEQKALVEIKTCGKCKQHICPKHLHYMEFIAYGLFQSEQRKYGTLCPSCRGLLLEQWHLLESNFGLWSTGS